MRSCIAAYLVFLAFVAATPVAAQSLPDRDCPGTSDASEGIDGKIKRCSDAIATGSFSGKDLADIYGLRGRDYTIKGDPDHALADFDQAIALDSTSATSFFGRGTAWLAKKDNDREIGRAHV